MKNSKHLLFHLLVMIPTEGMLMKLTDFLSIYAAVISTSMFAWNIISTRPKIKIDILFGVFNEDSEIKHGVYVVVRNVSSQDVYLSSISILYPYRDVSLKEYIKYFMEYKRNPKRLGWIITDPSNYSIVTGCPICLKARTSHRVFISESILYSMTSSRIKCSLIACAQDQLWNRAYSGIFRYPLNYKT